MSSKDATPTAPRDRKPTRRRRLAATLIGLVLVIGVVAAAPKAWAVLVIAVPAVWSWYLNQNITPGHGTIIGGTFVCVAALIAYTGTHLSRRSTERIATINNNLADLQELRRRFVTTTAQFADPSPEIRLAGVYALEALVDDWIDRGKHTDAQTCINYLCGYLTRPYTPHTEHPHLRQTVVMADAATTVERTYHHPHDDLTVRQAITRTIATHLQPDHHHNWSNYNYDLTGAHFHNADFTGSHFRGTTDFTEAHFDGEATSFGEAQFHSKNTTFLNAQFRSKDWTSFGEAQFYGEETSFREAQFHGKETSFREAQFHGKETSFDEAQFHGEETSFRKAQSRGKKASLLKAQFHGRKLAFFRAQLRGEKTLFLKAQLRKDTFLKAKILGEEALRRRPRREKKAAQFGPEKTSFDEAQFHGEETSFFRAQFYGWVTSFGSAQFYGEETSFGEAQFCSWMTSFGSAQFRSKDCTSFGYAGFYGHKSSFGSARFCSGETSFGSAQFHSGETSFRKAQFHGKETSFEEAQFHGEETSFRKAQFHGNKTSFHRPGAWNNVYFDWDTEVPFTPTGPKPGNVTPYDWPPTVELTP